MRQPKGRKKNENPWKKAQDVKWITRIEGDSVYRGGWFEWKPLLMPWPAKLLSQAFCKGYRHKQPF